MCWKDTAIGLIEVYAQPNKLPSGGIMKKRIFDTKNVILLKVDEADLNSF